jgi:hypothetical protein
MQTTPVSLLLGPNETEALKAEELALDLRLWLSAEAQAPSGAIVSWLDHESGRPAFEYPEISGYALTHFAGSILQGDQLHRELKAGKKAATWLTGLIDEERLAARQGWDSHAVYNFDLAMIANGLMVFGHRLHEDRLVEYGLSLTSRLIDQLERYGYLPCIDHETSPLSERTEWSTQGVAHLVKVAQCMLTGAVYGLDFAREGASLLVNDGIAAQQCDGRIVTHPDDKVTMLHPHLYAVEGLWVYGRATGDRRAMACARRAVAWAYRQRLPTGGLPRFATADDGTVGPEQCDVTAQFLRAAILTGFEGDLSPTIARLCSLALPNVGVGRAIPYQPHAQMIHRNIWASMFTAQACQLCVNEPSDALNWWLLV